MFWRKCGKLIATSPTGGSLINCDECPCPYYGIFFVTQYATTYDPEGGSSGMDYSNYCYKSLEPHRAGIFNNETAISLNANYGTKICIPISRSAAMSGLVGSRSGTIDSTEVCAEYNDDYTECLRYNKVSYDIKIYRIGKCFDDYDAFAEYFYGPCGVEPDSDGNYPAIFNGDPINGSYTSVAGDCLYTYWTPLAQELLIPRVQVETTMYGIDHQIHPREQYIVTDDDTGSMRVEYDCMTLLTNGNQTYYKIGGSGHYNEEGYWEYEAPDCCEYWSGSRDALSKINEKINEDKGNKESFIEKDQYIDTIPGRYNTMCLNRTVFTYIDGMDVHGYQNYHRRYGIIKFVKPDNARSDATGVRCIVTAYYQKYNQGEDCTLTNGDPPEPQYMYNNQEVTFRFGDTIETNILDNQVTFKIVNSQECANDCTYDSDSNRPEFNWCSHIGDGTHTEDFILHIAAIEYTFG